LNRYSWGLNENLLPCRALYVKSAK